MTIRTFTDVVIGLYLAGAVVTFAFGIVDGLHAQWWHMAILFLVSNALTDAASKLIKIR